MAVANASLRRSVVVFDELAAARHRSEFARLLDDPGLRGRVVAEVIESRARFTIRGGVSLTRVAVEQLEGLDGCRALIARGEVLVSAPSAEIVRLLTDSGFTCVGRAGVVLSFRNRHADAAAVRAICHELLWRGVRAAPNYVVYAGGIVKARLHLLEPLPTNTRPVVPSITARRSEVTVAVLDTAGDGTGGAAGHGSFVAGLVGQIAPGCRLDLRRVLASDGLGTDFSVALALHRIAADATSARVVNLSLYCAPVDGIVPVAMAAALDTLAARHPETVVVAAAGNDGSRHPSWPAAHPFVVAVGAVGEAGAALFSNHGPWVDFSARADGVVCRDVAWSGTSFAAAQVSGALAAMFGKGLHRAEALGELTGSGISTKGCGITVEPESII